MISPIKAVFLDKDGVLNKDTGINPYPDETEIFEYVSATLKQIKELGYLLILVTNQPVVARGLVTEKELIKRLDKFNILIGSYLDMIMYCPHHPDADLEKYRVSCLCRKPKPGMLLEASVKLNIDLSKSYMAGDRISDIIAGHLAGVKTVLIATGMQDSVPIVSDFKISEKVMPDYTISGLDEILTLL